MEIFEISIFLVLYFFLVGPSFNHTSANFENKKKEFFWMSLYVFVTLKIPRYIRLYIVCKSKCACK